jgi:hypothetical protein
MIDRGKIALLHVAKSRAGFDDETYRDFLEAHAGVRSSKDLTSGSFDAVMRAFEKKTGFVSTAKRQNRARRVHQPAALITPEQQAMIRELYAQLGWNEQSRQSGFSKRCCGKSFPQTRGDGIKVIEAQKAILARGEKPVIS